MAIVTYPLNGVTYNAEDAEGYLCTRESGVFAADTHFVATVTGNREITISPGAAWVKNTEFSGKSIVSRDPVVLTIPTADGALPRRDRIVIRFDKTMNKSEIVVKTGTPGSAAAAPDVERSELLYELGIYTVYVPAASLAVSEANVTNTMLDETVCGLMKDPITGIPTAQMGAQWDAMVTDLTQAVENAKGGNLLTRTQYTAIARVSGWVMESDGRYVNTVTVSGIVPTDEGNIDVDMTDATMSTAATLTDGWSMIDKAETVTGGVKLTCFSDIPGTDIPIVIEVVR